MFKSRLTNDRQLFLNASLIIPQSAPCGHNSDYHRQHSHHITFQSCELLLLSKLGWDVYLDCSDDQHLDLMVNLNFAD